MVLKKEFRIFWQSIPNPGPASSVVSLCDLHPVFPRFVILGRTSTIPYLFYLVCSLALIEPTFRLLGCDMLFQPENQLLWGLLCGT